MRALVLILALAGCTEFDIFLEAAGDEGTVYACTLDDGREVEHCYRDDSADELGELLGGTCETTGRTWPWLTNLLAMGCTYECPAPKRPGSNAKNGMYCPEADE